MSDCFTPQERSAVMARVKSTRNRSTELRLIALMKAARITGWRRGSQAIGRPDFVFPTVRLAVFVDGCFWHGCPRCGETPRQNAEYWRAKIERNQRRDRRVTRNLRAEGWSVLRLWECELRTAAARRTVARLRRSLTLGRKRRREDPQITQI